MEKKTIKRIFLAALLVLLIEQMVLLFCGFGLPTCFGDTFMGELKSKYERLKTTPGNRIVLIGGSGVAFGYDCGMLKEVFTDYEVVNFGMYAGLGTKAMLDLSKEYLRPGDIAILSPEQSEQTLSPYFNAEYMWQAADGAFGLLRGVGKDNFQQLLGAYPQFAWEKLLYTLNGNMPQTDSVYRKASFDEYGDIKPEICQKNRMPQGYDQNQPVRFAKEIADAEFIDDVNSWAKALEAKGITVWYRYCPVNRLAVEDGDETLVAYHQYLRESLAFPIIGNIKSSLMEPEWFFDTNFHLNGAGKTVNTVQLIRDIKAMLADDSAVQITLPTKPEKTWEDKEKEHRIWTAKDSQSLQHTDTIRIPIEVTQIEDGAFADCKGLKRIILQQTDPAKCTVGQGLLEGSSAIIYVPQRALDSYKRNYFWSIYADRIAGYADDEENQTDHVK